ncbi:MAG TPA: RNA polymerase sigma factor [bacterium]|nr:RNA polymerase sigma factor [bacterium]
MVSDVAHTDEDTELVIALREGDEDAFVILTARYHVPMLRLASMYVSRAIAEEVVQDAWLGVLKGIGRFEARSSLRTWIFRILMNRTKTQMQREGRSIPFSALGDPAGEPAEPAVDPDRFLDATHPQWPNHWRTPPRSWGESPEDRLLAKETQAYIQQAIDTLPPTQREVITLRDMNGCTPEEVRDLLSVSAVNQRVLLHRARSRVRRALERYFEEGEGGD